MTSYYKVMLGKESAYAKIGRSQGFIGVDYEIDYDLTDELPNQWQVFNKEWIPMYLKNHPGSSKPAAERACKTVWTVCKNIQVGDVVLSYNVKLGMYMVGDIIGGYSFAHSKVLPHRRAVQWRPELLNKENMSLELRDSLGNYVDVVNLNEYWDELSALLAGQDLTPVIIDNEVVEDQISFQLEKQLESFLIDHWATTELGQKYDIYTVDGEQVGQQYQTVSGPIDILAISKDKKELLVVELKRGRVSDRVVGQVQRYMGFVVKNLAKEGQTVKGAIIALEDDPRVRLALLVAPNISFYTYQFSFKLKQMGGS